MLFASLLPSFSLIPYSTPPPNLPVFLYLFISLLRMISNARKHLGKFKLRDILQNKLSRLQKCQCYELQKIAKLI